MMSSRPKQQVQKMVSELKSFPKKVKEKLKKKPFFAYFLSDVSANRTFNNCGLKCM